jgi:DNA-binding SARP family transcriptional activator
VSGYYRVLGPVDVVFAGQVVSFGASKSRVLLAALLLRSNQYVSTGQMMTTLWGDNPPSSARATLHTYIMRLRKNLQQYQSAGRCPLRTEPGGYTFEAAEGTLDLIEFDAQLSAARSAARDRDAGRELEHLSRALSVWRGPALSNVESDLLHRDEVPRLTEQRLKATERRIDLQMAVGLTGELIPQLQTLTAEYPRRERFWGQLIEALYRSGRQAEALAAYRVVADHLAEELGVAPGPELRGLQLRILHGEPVTGAPVAPVSPPKVVIRQAKSAPPLAEWLAAPQCQLPTDAGEFVGREELSARLEELLAPAECRAGPAIATIDGAPGSGKTALAVHVAWRLREHFPDGQWFVNLRAGGLPRPPADTLAELLQATGVPRERMPFGEGALAGALRAALAGRRVLMLLDDASGLEQVAQLLPGAPGCAVIVTGRASVAGLTALHGGQSVHLPPLSREESLLLLGRLTGPARVRRERQAAQGIANICGDLPLTVRIAASQLSQSPWLSLTAYLESLVQHDPLAQLSAGLDGAFSPQATIRAAYAALTSEDQLAFLLLSMIGRPVLLPGQVAGVLDVSEGSAKALLCRLSTAHLLRGRPDGCYELPELQRCFAATLQPARLS